MKIPSLNLLKLVSTKRDMQKVLNDSFWPNGMQWSETSNDENVLNDRRLWALESLNCTGSNSEGNAESQSITFDSENNISQWL